MSVYHVYTKTMHIPTFVLYECQKCKSIVTTVGAYDVSATYSDRGATRKRFAKRENAANEQLMAERDAQAALLKRAATPVHYDYQKIRCKCPKCGHESLCKIANPGKVGFFAAWAVIGIFWIIQLIKGITNHFAGTDFATVIIGGAVGSLVAAGLLSSVFEWIINRIVKAQMASLCEKTPPLISSNRDILMKEAREMPAYKNADFSGIMSYPAVLEQNTNQ